MRIRIIMLIFVVEGALLFNVLPAIATEEAAMQQLAENNNAFALDLYQELRLEPGDLFFSPYSISTALAMTYAGARGTTARQMADALHFLLESDVLHSAFARLAEHFDELQQQGEVALNVANALWIQQEFELQQDFLDIMKQFYHANLFHVNFAEAFEDVRQEINAWVEKHTQEKIIDLLAPGTLSALTRLVLTNAIYFKGNWELPFDEDATVEAPFWINLEQSVAVAMMYQQAMFKYGETDDVQILMMPYAGDALAMFVLLPKEKTGLSGIEEQLSVEQLASWMAESTIREVEVFFPKFTFSSQFSLTSTLKSMGMPDAFSEQADFSGLTANQQLSISDVVHKAFVEVNEEGTEAAAATAVVVGLAAIMDPQPIPVFRADHPFIFIIHDKRSGSFLFIGRVMNSIS